MQEQVFYKRIDFNIIISVVFLSVYGLIMLYSSSMDDSLLKSQTVFLIAGFVMMLLFQFLNYKWLKYTGFLTYLGAIVLILLLKIPSISVTKYDATRWIRVFGIQVQISEPVKALLIIFLAYYVSTHIFEVNKTKGVIKVWAMAAVVALLILKISSNLSSCLILLMITFCITFISSDAKLLHYGSLAAVFAAAILLYLYFSVNSPSVAELEEIKKHSYQLARIIAWTNPEKYVEINGYQVVQGIYAIGAGGLFGKGLGDSVQKHLLPEAQNDMIVCIIAEELGIVGVAVLIFLYIYLIYHILQVAINARDIFGRLICAGVMCSFTFQALVNIAVATAVIPNTGVTLPFVSAGGSAVMIAFFQVALVLSVYRKEKKRVEKN